MLAGESCHAESEEIHIMQLGRVLRERLGALRVRTDTRTCSCSRLVRVVGCKLTLCRNNTCLLHAKTPRHIASHGSECCL
jgi:hypothetical protein